MMDDGGWEVLRRGDVEARVGFWAEVLFGRTVASVGLLSFIPHLPSSICG
jgi:hypothetical protein